MGLLRRIKNVLTGARQAEQLAQINRRLERLEAQGETLHKIWLRTRHVEPAIQALLRARYFDPASLPYPERHVLYAENVAALLRSLSRRDRLFDDVRDDQRKRLRRALDDAASLLEQIRRRDRK